MLKFFRMSKKTRFRRRTVPAPDPKGVVLRKNLSSIQDAAHGCDKIQAFGKTSKTPRRMPELPEVEVTRRGLAPSLEGKTLTDVAVRTDKLRESLEGFDALLGARLKAIRRRAKYLIWCFEARDATPLWFVTHMGMSGSWRILHASFPQPRVHEHFDLVFGDVLARYRDPRRFGSARLFSQDPFGLSPISKLGPEPDDENLTTESFYKALHTKKTSVKEVLLSGKCVAGCGNIYASEALFAARIHPATRADRVSKAKAAVLLDAVRKVLSEAVAAGGSTLRDFHNTSGEDGYFALNAAVYGREGEPCPVCGTAVKRSVQGGRSTFSCPKCQK